MAAITPAVPYVAPWATGFTRYSTQINVVRASASNVYSITVPTGKWWRVVYFNGVFTTGAAVGNRIVQVTFNVSSFQVLNLYAAVAQPASVTGRYVFAPNFNSFGVNTGGDLVAQGTVPDVLWPPGTQISMTLMFAQSGDGTSSVANLAAEEFTEDANTPGALTLTPGPVIV